ncbi:hypothetical protein VCHENC02_1675A, partial [Vibrio harveyi]
MIDIALLYKPQTQCLLTQYQS